MLLLAADMAVLGLLARHGVSTRWLLLYAVHPLILKEAMGSAHPDGVVALLLLLALLAWRRRFAVATGAMLGLAAGAKVAALVVLPLLLFAPPENQADGQPAGRIRGWVKRVAAGFALVLVVLYVPFVWRSGSDIVALGIFGNEWRFNPLLFRLIEVVVPGPAARVLAALLIVAGIGAICWGWRRQSLRTGGQTLPPLDTALVLLLVLSPVVNPWYWLWALPLSVFLGRGWVAAAGVFAAISYFNTSVLEQAIGWNGAGPDAPYAVPWPLALVQLLVLGAAVYADRVGAADKRRLQCNG